MRGPLIALLACIVAVGAMNAWSAESAFPYKAYVTADDVYVRSGPGENYYPTDQLKAGTEVEVYRHDPGGWYAIRPPKTASRGSPAGTCNSTATTWARSPTRASRPASAAA